MERPLRKRSSRVDLGRRRGDWHILAQVSLGTDGTAISEPAPANWETLTSLRAMTAVRVIDKKIGILTHRR